MEEIKQILNSEDLPKIKALFAFDKTNSHESVVFKFGLWARYTHPKYFKSKDAPFHKEMDLNLVKTYRGEINQFVNIAFRGASKTAKTKLFLAYAILNDLDHTRRYIKVLSADGVNSKQIVTDIYNMLVSPRCKILYPEVFAKTDLKREETMGSFTTATGIKMIADVVGADQRGALQEDAKSDLILYEDIETRGTLRSAVKTKAIWDNMEEARTGLAVGGSAIYNCNYISERGNVHQLVTRQSGSKVVLIVPILTPDGLSAWEDRYTLEQIEHMRKTDDDFEGERLCKPSASKDVLFDRESIDKQVAKQPIKTVAGFKIFKEYNPSHRIAGAGDVSLGVGLDSSTTVFIDFDTMPAQVIGTYYNNEIKPDDFGDEMARQGRMFGECLLAPENNNAGVATIARLKQIYPMSRIYATQKNEQGIKYTVPNTFGWNTNALTKGQMFNDLSKAVEDGLIELNDPDLIAEARSYSRNDLMDRDVDVRLVTRHYDILTSCAIAWQMKDYAVRASARKELNTIDKLFIKAKKDDGGSSFE